MSRKPRSQAGRSARAEYTQKHSEYQARWRAALPKRVLIIVVSSLAIGFLGNGVLSSLGIKGLGFWIGAMVAVSLIQVLLEPAKHVEAWRKGAVGEEKTERWLRKLPSEFIVLHDLAIPGSKANVDHLVLGPSGAFVIDSKNYQWKITENRAGELWSGRYSLAQAIETVKWEATKVAEALEVPVQVLLCVHGAELPQRNLVKVGVRITGPRGTLRAVQEGPAILAPAEVQRLAGVARQRLGQRA